MRRPSTMFRARPDALCRRYDGEKGSDPKSGSTTTYGRPFRPFSHALTSKLRLPFSKVYEECPGRGSNSQPSASEMCDIVFSLCFAYHDIANLLMLFMVSHSHWCQTLVSNIGVKLACCYTKPHHRSSHLHLGDHSRLGLCDRHEHGDHLDTTVCDRIIGV